MLAPNTPHAKRDTVAVIAPEIVPTERVHARTQLGALSVAGFASLGAGAIHAAAIGVHTEHRQAVVTFTVVAVLQLGWGALALAHSRRLLAAAGAVINVGAAVGWGIAKVSGIGFIDGLDESEPVQLADGLAAGLAIASALLAIAFILGFALHASSRPGRGLTALSGFAAVALATTGMVSAGSHSHAGGHGHGAEVATGGHDHGDGAVAGDDHDHDASAVVPPKPYDPTKPIDLGGVDGVSLEQQARAENLIAITLARLPRFADTAAAEAAGYSSIGDGVTGYEHYVNTALINDGKLLDPDYPESLVYQVRDGKKTLVAAMYMMHSGTTLDDVPDVGGPLTQWHIHNDLCFTPDPDRPRVAGLTNSEGECRSPLVKDPDPEPMIHVWIVPHECGPFAALEGVGGGQIAEGETRLCDHAHGSA
jgi:hypothetical protein